MYIKSGVESQKYHLKLACQMINLLTNKKKIVFFFIKSVEAIQILKCELTTFELTTHLKYHGHAHFASPEAKLVSGHILCFQTIYDVLTVRNLNHEGAYSFYVCDSTSVWQ